MTLTIIISVFAYVVIGGLFAGINSNGDGLDAAQPEDLIIWPILMPVAIGQLIARKIRERSMEPLNSSPWPIKKD